jgi:hypothetical protein
MPHRVTNTGSASYCVKPGWGYIVEVYNAQGKMVERYTAGDSASDSQVYETGDLTEQELVRYARRTARDLLQERALRGSVRRVADLCA